MVSPLIPALIGAGTTAAGGIAGMMGRSSALAPLRRRAAGQGLASTQAANRAARQSIGLSQARGTRNPNLAMRNALLANQELQANVAEAQANEVARAQEQVAAGERADSDLLMRILMGAGAGLAGGTEALIASEGKEADRAHQLQMLQTLLGGRGAQGGVGPIQNTEFPGMAQGEAAQTLSAPATGAGATRLPSRGTTQQPGAPGLGTPQTAGASVPAPAPNVPFVEEQRVGLDPVQGPFVPPRAPLPPNGTVPMTPGIDPNQIGLDQGAPLPPGFVPAPAPAQQAPQPGFMPEGAPLQERPIGPFSSIFPLFGMGLRTRGFA